MPWSSGCLFVVEPRSQASGDAATEAVCFGERPFGVGEIPATQGASGCSDRFDALGCFCWRVVGVRYIHVAPLGIRPRFTFISVVQVPYQRGSFAGWACNDGQNMSRESEAIRSMAVIYEAPESDVDYTAFVRERDVMRTQAWARVAKAQSDRDVALAEAVDRARAFAAEMRESAERGGTYSIGERIRIRFQEKKMRVALTREAEREYAVVERHYYGTWGQPGATRAIDMEDYRQAVVDAYDRDQLDPVLRAVPRSRRHVDANGWSVYTTKSMLHGTRELLRSVGDLTYVRGTDDTVIRAAVALAASRSRNPLKFNGSPAFVARAQEIAREMGVPTVGATAPTPNTISTDSPGADEAPSPYSTAHTSPRDVEPVEEMSPDLIERGRRAAAEARGEDLQEATPTTFGAPSGGVEPAVDSAPASGFDAKRIASVLGVDRADIRPGMQLGEEWSTDGVVLADGTVEGQRYLTILTDTFGPLVIPVPNNSSLDAQTVGATVALRCNDAGVLSAASESRLSAEGPTQGERSEAPEAAPSEETAKPSRSRKPRGKRS